MHVDYDELEKPKRTEGDDKDHDGFLKPSPIPRDTRGADEKKSPSVANPIKKPPWIAELKNQHSKFAFSSNVPTVG